ncbi:MAG: ABC transporter ATP-binding protein/permease [Bacteroidaceae bacterium]|nr:ABC transporter ATP-binding protein/permease [Bacteroidaceae bacterium]
MDGFQHIKLSKSEIRDCWQLIKPWWVSEEKWVARGLFFLVFLLDMSIVAVGAWLTYWNKNFFNAFTDYNLDLVWKLMLQALLIAVCGIAAEALRTWFYQTLQMRWRKWITNVYLKKWLNDATFYHIENNQWVDNADQRISEDLKEMTEMSLHLTLGFFSNIVNLVTFSLIIWEISGTLSFMLFGLQVNIPGYMLWVSIIYALCASIVIERRGKKMVAVEYEQQVRESDFRFQMMRIRENSAQIAISNGEKSEQRMLKRLFAKIERNWDSYKQYTRRITIIEKGYTEFGILLAYLIIIPRYFAKEITLGSIMQLTMSFTKVRVGFAWFIFQYKRLASLRSMCHRLSEFYNFMNIDYARNINFRKSEDGALKVDGLKLSLRSGRVITSVPKLQIEPGSRWLIRGNSGAGKTTFLKALAGIWQYGEGTVHLPDSKMLFLPQEPYMPLDSLRAALCYPELPETFSDAECSAVLEKCGLKQYIANLDDEDITWSRKLSPGEKQRLAFAKCLLIKPDFLFMDEATSALDNRLEGMLFEKLLEELPSTAIVSVAHRLTVDKYHDQILTI